MTSPKKRNKHPPIISRELERELEMSNEALLPLSVYQQVVKEMPHAMLIVNLAGEIQFANAACAQLLGYLSEELSTMPLGRLMPQPADVFQAFRTKRFQDTSQQFYLGKADELKIVREDGSSIYIELSLSPFETSGGCFVMASIVDVNDHHLTQLELSRSNQELDQFAYVASHDLKAPLRGIDNLASWIWEDIDDRELVVDHIQNMRCRVQRMQSLLNDLLEYSRVGKTDTKLGLVDINFMAQDLYTQSSPPEHFRLVLDKGLTPFKTMPAPFGQVLRNLINNAIKHNDQDEGVISIASCDKGEFIEYSVKDNGPGIDAQYHQKIFGMFEKLVSKDQVEGSGMGLAMVKKITESVGGSISVISSLGKGSQFCVTWPKAPADRSTTKEDIV